MAEDIFTGATPPNDEAFLETYVGEGKKFKDVNELAKAYANADKFIPELKNELHQTREFIAEELKKIAERTPAPPAKQNDEDEGHQPASAAPPNDEGEDLDTRIMKALELRDTKARFQKNADIVQDVLVERLGSVDKAAEAVVAKARELGLAPTDMKELAAKSPKAFLTTMGIDPDKAPVSSNTPGSSSEVNAAALKDAQSKPGTYAFYEELRKSDPKLYWKPATQSRLMKDAQDNPDFFNR